MTIPCKPEASLVIEANALYVLNMKSQGPSHGHLTEKIRVSTDILLYSFRLNIPLSLSGGTQTCLELKPS